MKFQNSNIQLGTDRTQNEDIGKPSEGLLFNTPESYSEKSKFKSEIKSSKPPLAKSNTEKSENEKDMSYMSM